MLPPAEVNDNQPAKRAAHATASSPTDEDSVSSFVGVDNLTPLPGGPAAAVTRLASAAELAERGGYAARYAGVGRLGGATFGNPVPFAPLFYWRDPNPLGQQGPRGAGKAERGAPVVLGRYAQSSLPSLVASEAAAGYHVVYSGAPNLPRALLRELASSAGVHLYTQEGHAADDAIDAHGNALHVHAGALAGSRRILLPEPLLVEGEDGAMLCSTPCAAFGAADMRAAESRLYYVRAEA